MRLGGLGGHAALIKKAMNIIDLLLLIFVFISIAFAVYRGFLASLLGVAACLLSYLFASLAGPALAAALGRNQGLVSLLATYTDAGSLIGDYSLSVIPAAAINESMLETVMKNITLPPLVQEILRQNLLTSALQGSAFSVNDYVVTTIVTVLLRTASFILCFFAAFLTLHTLINLIDHVFYFPVLRHFDLPLAAVMGALRGAAVIYVLLLIVPIVRVAIPFDLVEQFLSQSSLIPLFGIDGFFLRVVTGA